MNDLHPKDSRWIVTAEPDTFESEVIERSKQLPVVVDFWAEWCQPCRMLAPILEKLALEYDGKFLLVKANTEQVPQWAAQFAVQSIPAVFGLRGGQTVDFFLGLLPEEHIRAWIDRLLPSAAETLSTEADALAASDPAAAEEKYRQAMELDATLAAPRIALAELLLGQQRFSDCRQLIAELEQRGFLEPEAEKVKAALELHQQGAHAGGVEACRAAVAERPDDLRLQLKLAEALAAASEYEESLQIALKIVQADRKGLGEPARKTMVDVFRMLPDDSELTSTYRRKLSAALY